MVVGTFWFAHASREASVKHNVSLSLSLSLSHTHTHTCTHTHTHTLTLVCSLSQHSASAPVSLPRPASACLPACLQDTIRTSLCVCVCVYVCMCVCVCACVRVFVGESYSCIYVVRSFQHLMQYDIFHFASNPGYFCLLHRISYCTSAP